MLQLLVLQFQHVQWRMCPAQTSYQRIRRSCHRGTACSLKQTAQLLQPMFPVWRVGKAGSPYGFGLRTMQPSTLRVLYLLYKSSDGCLSVSPPLGMSAPVSLCRFLLPFAACGINVVSPRLCLLSPRPTTIVGQSAIAHSRNNVRLIMTDVRSW